MLCNVLRGRGRKLLCGFLVAGMTMTIAWKLAMADTTWTCSKCYWENICCTTENGCKNYIGICDGVYSYYSYRIVRQSARCCDVDPEQERDCDTTGNEMLCVTLSFYSVQNCPPEYEMENCEENHGINTCEGDYAGCSS